MVGLTNDHAQLFSRNGTGAWRRTLQAGSEGAWHAHRDHDRRRLCVALAHPGWRVSDVSSVMADPLLDVLTQLCVERGIRPAGAEGPLSAALGRHEHARTDTERLRSGGAVVTVLLHLGDEPVEFVGEIEQHLVGRLVVRGHHGGRERKRESCERGSQVLGRDRCRGHAASPFYPGLSKALRERRECF